MEGVEECQLCCRVVDKNSTTLKPITFLSSYLYHKNVRETLLPSPHDVLEGDESSVGGRVPKLTFTFSCGGIQPPSTDEMLLCDVCLKEVNQLESLHRQLESCKKLITAQVDRIESVCGTEDTAIRGNQKRESPWIKRSMGLGSDVALAGISIGSDNISLVLRGLASLCDGICSSYGSSTQTGPLGDASQVLSDITKMEQDDEDEVNVYETDATEPLVDQSVQSVESSIDPSNESQQTVLYKSNSSTSQESVTTGMDVGEVFIQPIKFDSTSVDHRNDATSELGELDPLEFYSQTINTDPLQEEVGYRPSDSVGVGSTLTTDQKLSIFPSILDPSPCNIQIMVSKPKTPNSDLAVPPTKRVKEAKTKPCKKLACKICGKMIKRISLYGHMKRHAGSTPYKCEVCGKGFLTKIKLEEHRRVHTGEKPFSCPFCDYSCAQLANFKRHLKKLHLENRTKKGAK